MTGAGGQTSVALRQAKQALRTSVLARRDALDAQQRERLSDIITARLLDLPEFKRAHCILAYLSFGGEFQTAPFVEALLSRGCALALPRVDRGTRRLQLYRVADLHTETVAGTWGIREPDPARCMRAELSAIDAVLVPGVAFTPACERLGYGGGYYDALIRDWSDHPPLIAGAFDLQIVENLPFGPLDQLIDAVITEAQAYSKSATMR